jgi:hypothetical protein
MAVTDTDITNRALQLIGTRTTVASLGEASNEAIQASLVYNPLRDWCFGLVNWNFARASAVLTIGKSVAPPVTTWTTASPTPPWLYEYKLPSDFIRAIYLTNNLAASDNSKWLGEPQRFVIATDTITSVQQSVLLTDQSPAFLVYTSRITDPTLWPWLFERLVVSMLARTLCYVLTGDKELSEELTQHATSAFMIAEQANREEGLSFGDTTPEWIQTLGIDYPRRRKDNRLPEAPPNDNKR